MKPSVLKSVPSKVIGLLATKSAPPAVIVIVRPTLSPNTKSVSVARVLPADMLPGVSAGFTIVGVMRISLPPAPVLSSFEQAVITIAATAANVKIFFIILSFKI